MMQDLKTGHLLGGSPRAQFLAQLIGSAVSIVVAVAAYELYKVRNKSEAFIHTRFPVIDAVPWIKLVACIFSIPLRPVQVAYGVPDRLRPPSSEVWRCGGHIKQTRPGIGRFG